jgi:UDPglucose--hexose-1-phosphate uridylyltransferase
MIDPASSRLVHDPLSDDWVVFAPGRRYRPEGRANAKRIDPFSPAGLREQKTLAIYGKGNNRVTVVENNYPIFHVDRELHGRQEILVEGSRPIPFASFSVLQIQASLDAMVERARAYRRDPSLKYMVVFKNEGKAAGASQPHPHSQIFGLPFVPERAKRLWARSRVLLRKHGMSAHALAMRSATKALMIFSDRSVIAFAHLAGRLPYEVRILTRRAHDNLTQTSSAERHSLAKALHALFPLIRERGYAYNFFFHDAFGEKGELFEIRFAPRSNVWGGFELDAGISVNPVPPEIAAEEYRDAA